MRREDVFGVTWVVLAIAVVVAPALLHGTSLGPYDLLSRTGFLHRSGVTIQNGWGDDLVDAIIPWQTLAWQQVHQGHLPLWNPYSGLGMPLAFNWQSAAFSLPVSLGYLVPVRFAYTVGTLATLVVAGTGAYAFSRVLRIGALGAAVAGTVFALSGPMTAWGGFPHASVMSWSGWFFAVAVMMTTARNRVRNVTLFAVVLALAIYAGQPEILVLIGLALGAFLVIVLASRSPALGGSGPVLKPVLDLSLATVAGFCLAAPLALPGFALVRESARANTPRTPAFPMRQLIYFITQNFDGAPVRGSNSFGQVATFFGENLAYIGIITLVLAMAAVVVRYRKPEIVALAVILVGSCAVLFVPRVARAANGLPVLSLSWHRLLLVVAFVVAVLAGAGADVLVHSGRSNRVLGIFGAGFAAAAGFVAAIWIVGRGLLPPRATEIRADSMRWPLVEAAVGTIAIGTLLVLNRRAQSSRSSSARAEGSSGPRRTRPSPSTIAGAALLVCLTAFLVAAGIPLRSSSDRPFAATQQVTELRRAVGSKTIGLDAEGCGTQLGIPPNANIFYGLHQMNMYDPLIPSRYWAAWGKASGQNGLYSQIFVHFCPTFPSVALARRLGVEYVLAPVGKPGPPGATRARTIGAASLWRVPGSGEATLTPLERDGTLPAVDRFGTGVRVRHPDPATWRMTTNSNRPSTLRARITNVDGWHASVDGHEVPLTTYADLMLQAKVPAGRHEVTLTYWPDSFRLGIVLALTSVVGLITALVVSRRRSRRVRASVDGPAP